MRQKYQRNCESFHGFLIVVSVAWLFTSAGCSGQSKRLHPPYIDSTRAGTTAVSTYDTDGNGTLSGRELDKATSLKSDARQLDRNRDGLVTSEEITQRIDAWRKTNVSLIPLSCQVMLNGRPLSHATVTLTPEQFLGDNIKSATGITNSKGLALPTIAEEHREDKSITGVHFGYYKVSISRLRAGKETLPAVYNQETMLGCKVAPQDMVSGLMFSLKSSNRR